MKATRLWFTALCIGAAVVVLSCEQSASTGPDLAVPLANLSAGQAGLLYCKPMAYDSVSQTIGRQGGLLRVSRHVLTIPVGAVRGRVEITLVAPSDTLNRIRARPEGLLFQHPVALTMSYANCNGSGSPQRKQIAHLDEALQFLEYVESVDHPRGSKVTGQLTHFSEYAVSW